MTTQCNFNVLAHERVIIGIFVCYLATAHCGTGCKMLVLCVSQGVLLEQHSALVVFFNLENNHGQAVARMRNRAGRTPKHQLSVAAPPQVTPFDLAVLFRASAGR